MTEAQALKIFNEICPRERYRTERGFDIIARREHWGIFIDMLCRDGVITLKQYESWDNPF